MVIECSYRGTECSHPRNWKTIYTRYGKCYTFNNPDDEKDIKMTLKGGVDNGLEVLLNLEQEEYMPVWSDSGESTQPLQVSHKYHIIGEKLAARIISIFFQIFESKVWNGKFDFLPYLLN